MGNPRFVLVCESSEQILRSPPPKIKQCSGSPGFFAHGPQIGKRLGLRSLRMTLLIGRLEGFRIPMSLRSN